MKQSLGGSTEAAFSFVETSAVIGNRGGASSPEPRLVHTLSLELRYAAKIL